jgi:transcriptional regulator with XRE-family HTH domain
MIMVMFIQGDLVRLRRKKLGYSQESLAAAAGVDQASISLIETGKGNPTAGVLFSLADVLDTSVDYLLGRTDDPTPPMSNSPDHFARKELRVIELWRDGKKAEAAALILTDSS